MCSKQELWGQRANSRSRAARSAPAKWTIFLRLAASATRVTARGRTPKCRGDRGQGGARGLAVHSGGADPDHQRAVMLAAHAGAGRPGPDPEVIRTTPV